MFDLFNHMGQFILGMWHFILGWFRPDMIHGVFWGALIVTFVASVMGKDQEQRLEQGKFGLAAGTSLGGLSALIKPQQPQLLVVGFVGSAVGGLFGWLYYLALALLLAKYKRLEKLLAFQVGGLEGLRKKLDVESQEHLKDGFETWSEKLTWMIADMKDVLLQRTGPGWEEQAIMVIRSWLTTAVDALALVFGTLGDKPKNQSRVTIIVYRHGANNGQAAGKHWISYSGQLKPHSKEDGFDQNSIGYKVLTGKLASPYSTTNEIAKKEGQTRPADDSYRPFVTFRLNDDAIMALDWPPDLAESDYGYVESARSLFYACITPAIHELLNRWPTPLADAAGVGPLPALPAQPTGAAGAIPTAPPPAAP